MNPRGRRQRLNNIQQIADALRQSDAASAPAPDLTRSILDRVDAERPFLSAKTRRTVIGGRFALGLSVAAVVLGISLMHRWAPDAIELAARPAPLSSVVESVRAEATEGLTELRNSVQTAALAADSPAAGQPAALFALVSARVPAEAAPKAEARCPNAPAFCVDRPLADASRLARMGPGQSPWAGYQASARIGSGFNRSPSDDLSPLMVGRELDATLAPK